MNSLITDRVGFVLGAAYVVVIVVGFLALSALAGYAAYWLYRRPPL